MAKQSGIHQLKGKVRDMSYYRQKGVVDGLARSINQGLSKRVKEDAAYQNTRLNAAEFGTAGSVAGAFIRAISDRQRAMLTDFATGELAKVMKSLLLLDEDNPWGQRLVDLAGKADLIIDTINTYAKNDFSQYVGGVWDVSVQSIQNGNTWTPNAELPANWGAMLSAKGATGAYVDMYGYLVNEGRADNGSARSYSNVEVIANEDFTIGEASTITSAASLSAEFSVAPVPQKFVQALIVVRPYKEVNGVKYIMQELCTFKLSKVD